MTRNARNGLWKRMQHQELSLLGISMKDSVRPPMPERKGIPEGARVLETIDYPLALRLEFRL